jgi:hypothetical protein
VKKPAAKPAATPVKKPAAAAPAAAPKKAADQGNPTLAAARKLGPVHMKKESFFDWYRENTRIKFSDMQISEQSKQQL